MELNYTVQGIGPVVLFVHGLPTSRQLWDRVLPLLRSHFTCVAVDLPGFGRSPMLPNAKFDPDSYAHTLEELRRHLDVPSWHVIGHDAGSTIAVHYAVRYQEHLSRLVLCSPPVFPELQIPPFFRLLRVPVIGDMLALLLLPLFWRFIFPAVVQASSNSGSAANIIQAFHWP
ncbi:MAG: alpha/beta hydrolase, partial [Anaerolineae bacterium]|nr:alpha/beta hydrolase [Anaerolineae bacterium]